jgi:hypothetical protein
MQSIGTAPKTLDTSIETIKNRTMMKYMLLRTINLGFMMVLILSCFGCHSPKVLAMVEFEEPIIDDSEINFHDREVFFPVFLDSLKGELRKGKLPSFLLDECLDMHYSYELTSHTFISTRYILFEQLTARELRKIWKLSKKYDLSQTCNRNASFVLMMSECKSTDQIEHSKKSTLQLLQERRERLK